jgi:large subunit ribosomal protein L29
MKPAEYLKSLRDKDAAALNDELAALRKEQFNLRMQRATGQQTKSHLVTQARKKVAQLKTVLRSKVKAS